MIRKPTWSGGELSTRPGSRAPSEIEALRATEAPGSRRISGSVEFTSHRTITSAMLLSMIVVITSWAPVRTLRTPGMKP